MARQLLAIGLAMALLLVASPTLPAVAADEERDVYDAAAFKLAAEAIVAAQGQKGGATWKGLDKTTREIIERRIQRIKDEREALAKKVKAALAEQRGQEHECERAAIEHAWKSSDAQLEHYLKRLRHARGDKRSDGTRIWRSFQHNALKPLEELAKRSLPKSPLELIKLYLSGGSAAVVDTVKRNAIRIVREDLLIRVATGQFRGRAAVTSDVALREACGEKAQASPAPEDVAGPQPGGFASGAWQLGACTASAQFSLDGFMPAPPYGQPYTLVRFDWPERHDVMLTYFATSGDPNREYPIFDAVMVAGCMDEHEQNNCAPLIPLVFTQAPEATEGKANNRVVKPGTYTLAVEPKGACIYTDKQGNWKVDYPYPSSIEVTTTVEHYAAGASTPYAVEGPLTTTVPFWSDDPFALPLPGPNRRVVGEIEWDGQSRAPAAQSEDAPSDGSDDPAPWDVEPSPVASAPESE
jgi:hypothetical protein